MVQEKISCPFCAGWVTAGAVCEYCGNFVPLMSPLGSGRTQAKGEKKETAGTSKQETFRTVQNAENGKWGVLDSEGLQIIPFEYDKVYINLPFFILGKKVSLQNKEEKLLYGAYSIKLKKILVPIEYNDINVKSFESGKYFYLITKKKVFYTIGDRLMTETEYGLYNSEKELLPCKYVFFSDYHAPLIKFMRNLKWGLCNIRYGEVIFPSIYENIDLKGKYAEVTEDKKKGLYNISDKYPIQILPISYEEIQLADNWLLVKKEYWGISNYAGEEIIPCLFDKIEFDGTENLKLYYGDNRNNFLQIKINEGKVTKGDSPKMLALYGKLVVLCLIASILFFVFMAFTLELWTAITSIILFGVACLFFLSYSDLKKYRVK